MCDTGRTIKLATNALKEGGAKTVYAVVSHGQSGLPNTIVSTLLTFGDLLQAFFPARAWRSSRSCPSRGSSCVATT